MVGESGLVAEERVEVVWCWGIAGEVSCVVIHRALPGDAHSLGL